MAVLEGARGIEGDDSVLDPEVRWITEHIASHAGYLGGGVQLTKQLVPMG